MNNSFTAPTWGFFVLSMVFIMFNKLFRPSPSLSAAEAAAKAEAKAAAQAAEAAAVVREMAAEAAAKAKAKAAVEAAALARAKAATEAATKAAAEAKTRAAAQAAEAKAKAAAQAAEAKAKAEEEDNFWKLYPQEAAAHQQLLQAEEEVSKRLRVANDLLEINRELKEMSGLIVQDISRLKMLETQVSNTKASLKTDLDEIGAFLSPSPSPSEDPLKVKEFPEEFDVPNSLIF